MKSVNDSISIKDRIPVALQYAATQIKIFNPQEGTVETYKDRLAGGNPTEEYVTITLSRTDLNAIGGVRRLSIKEEPKDDQENNRNRLRFDLK